MTTDSSHLHLLPVLAALITHDTRNALSARPRCLDHTEFYNFRNIVIAEPLFGRH